LILAVGSRLDTRQTGGKPETFAREAKKIIVDIEAAEIFKDRGLKPDLGIVADAKEFIGRLLGGLNNFRTPNTSEWLKKIKIWKDKYPLCPPACAKQSAKVNMYYFMKILAEELKSDDIIITDTGSNLIWTLQGFCVKDGQRLFSAFGNSPMGYSLPAAIGASIALNNKPIICIIGDGGLQMNIQELQTIYHYKLPIKIFVINNNAYGLIKQFQDIWFNSHYEAACPEKGCSFPDFLKVGQAYGLKTEMINNHEELRSKLKKALASNEAILCNVEARDDEKIIPKLEFGKPIEDAAPLLDRDEFKKEMIIKPLD